MGVSTWILRLCGLDSWPWLKMRSGCSLGPQRLKVELHYRGFVGASAVRFALLNGTLRGWLFSRLVVSLFRCFVVSLFRCFVVSSSVRFASLNGTLRGLKMTVGVLIGAATFEGRASLSGIRRSVGGAFRVAQRHPKRVVILSFGL